MRIVATRFVPLLKASMLKGMVALKAERKMAKISFSIQEKENRLCIKNRGFRAY